ncbi:MAG: OsmC family protein [Proteobacteria bacterium]|nr:OsmC family protein [Pseudomonadota bacterium]
MDTEELKEIQAPLKQQYKDNPDTALITLRARSRIGEGITCKVETGQSLVEAGLHPATGGSGLSACSGDMLLEALVACAGVTLGAVATSIGVDLRDATISAEGDLDFRGTLAVDKEALVGFKAIWLNFDLDSDADDVQLASLIKLTERYCVVYQTLTSTPDITISH